MKLLLFSLPLWILSFNLKAQEANWSRFRGPNGSGIAAENARPPVVFGEDNHLKWKIEMPEGISSPIVWKDHVYITGCLPETNVMVVQCIDKSNGSLLWIRKFFPETLEGAHSISSPAQSTPSADENGLYVYSTAYGIICYDHDGNVKWENKEMPMFKHRWGHPVSPVVMDDKIILSLDFWGDGYRGLAAFSTETGAMVWRNFTQKISRLNDAYFTGYSTPVRFKNQIILHRVMGLASYALEDGSANWWMELFTTAASSPIVSDSCVYVSFWNHFTAKENLGKYWEYESFSKLVAEFDTDSDQLVSKDEFPEDFALASRSEIGDYEGATNYIRNYWGEFDKDKNGEVDSLEWNESFKYFKSFLTEVGTAMIYPVHKGRTSLTSLNWMKHTHVPEVPTPILLDGCIYTISDGGWLTSMDAGTGELVCSERLGKRGGYFASPVAANDKLYICAQRGTVQVIGLSEKPTTLWETDLEGKIMATPAIAGNDLFIRTSDYLYAFTE